MVAALCAQGAPPQPARVVLVGDSTLASRTGYGDALCAFFRPGFECVNLARGGRSTKSYRAEGLWDHAMAIVAQPRDGRTWVLIQFGHNDQPGKPGRSTDLETEFPANVRRYVEDARRAGAQPVLMTPLTRRTFKDGVLQRDLRPWAEATLKVAREMEVPVLDLNAESAARVEAMGQAGADTLAMIAPRDFDRTHLGPKGAELFARMVAHELAEAVPDLAQVLRP